MSTGTVTLWVHKPYARPTVSLSFKEVMSSPRCLSLEWWFIGAVAVLDAYLTISVGDTILLTEQNFICLRLIELDPHGMSYFLAAKGVGTVAVLLALCGIQARLPRLAPAIFGGVSGFQAWLLWFLTLSVPVG